MCAPSIRAFLQIIVKMNIISNFNNNYLILSNTKFQQCFKNNDEIEHYLNDDVQFSWHLTLSILWFNHVFNLQSATNCSGTNCPGTNCPVTNCLGTNCPFDELSMRRIVQGRIVRGRIVQGRIVRGRIVRGQIVRGWIVQWLIFHETNYQGNNCLGRIVRWRIVPTP